MRVEYRTSEGHIVEYTSNSDYFTVHDIDKIVMIYFEKTGREPKNIFMDVMILRALRHDMVSLYHINLSSTDNIEVLRLSLGEFTIVPVCDSYTPIFIGSLTEFEDNNFNRLFEEKVLNG